MRTAIKMSVLAFTIGIVGCNSNKVNVATVETPIAIEEVALAVLNPSEVVPNELKRSVVFIAGYDKGTATYYSDAKEFFENKNHEIVETAFSMQEIILWLNNNHENTSFSEVHIVMHNKMSKVSLETTVKGAKITTETLKLSIVDGSMPVLKNVLSSDAKIVIHSAGLGSQQELIDEFKKLFTTESIPSIVASENVSVFGGEFNTHYLAKPYYGFYPTANSPGRVDLAKELAGDYPDSDIDWLSALNNHSERFQGDVYSYKFNVPVQWEFEFNNEDEAPIFRTIDDLYAWMQDNDTISSELKALNIPIEKFRWYETTKGDTLIIKGKATVIVVLKPVMSLAYPQEYMIPTIDNLRLYTMI